MNADNSQTAGGYSNPWGMWLNFYQALHTIHVEWCHLWAHHCLPSLFPPHPHVGHHQLEIPDPLVEVEEPELFA